MIKVLFLAFAILMPLVEQHKWKLSVDIMYVITLGIRFKCLVQFLVKKTITVTRECSYWEGYAW